MTDDRKEGSDIDEFVIRRREALRLADLWQNKIREFHGEPLAHLSRLEDYGQCDVPAWLAVRDLAFEMYSQAKRPVADKEPVALFDIDGTLADFDGALTKQMRALASHDEPPWEADRFTEDEEPAYLSARRRLIKQIPGFWTNLPCLPDGFEILEAAIRRGYRIMVLSRGPRTNGPAWGEKLVWCRKNLPWDCQVTLTEDKGLVYGRVLVDDWPPYVERWLAWRKRGYVIMPARSWNEGFTHPQVLRFERGVNDSAAYAALDLQLRDCAL